MMLAAGSAGAATTSAGAVAQGLGQAAAAGIISTVAGGIGGPGKATKVAVSSCGVAADNGHLYVADNRTVRQVSPKTDQLTTPVGSGAAAPPGDGGPATSAGMSTCGVAVDHSGNLLIGDDFNDRVRVVAASTGTFYGQAMTAGHIYTIADDGVVGFGGDGGPATSAELVGPANVAVDAAGNVLMTDVGNRRIRVVAASTGTFYGQAMTAGDIYTIAGGGIGLGNGAPATSVGLKVAAGVAVDAAGNVLIADTNRNRIRVVAAGTGTSYGQAMTAGHIYTIAGTGRRGFTGDNKPAVTSDLDQPAGVTVDAAGNVLIADNFNNRIRVVAVSTGTFYGQAMTAGNIYTVAGRSGGGFSGDGGPATSATLSFPQQVAVDGAGNLLIADAGNDRVRMVPASTGTFSGKAMTAGHIYTVTGNGTASFSGDGGPATQAQLDLPDAVTLDPAGNQLICDSDNGRIRMVAAGSGTFYGQGMTAGHIYTIAGGGRGPGNGGPATNAGLTCGGVAVDAAGNLLFADVQNDRIRVVAAITGTFYGQAMTAGHIYTVAGDGKRGFSGDGGPALSAELDNPSDVSVDPTGNLVIADPGSDRVRVVAAATGTFYGHAMTAGDIYTVAGNGILGFSGDGGPATKASLNIVFNVTVDDHGNLVLSDFDNERIRVVADHPGTFYGQAMTTGHIYTVAGDGVFGFSGDGGPASLAAFNHPQGTAVDAAGNLLMCDSDNGRVRVVAASTGTFYGQAMTAGDIYTIAGGGTSGLGDGGPATGADLNPRDVAVSAAGNLLIADGQDQRIRMVTP